MIYAKLMFVFTTLGSIESSFSMASITTKFADSVTNPGGIPVEMRAIFTSKSPTWSPNEVPKSRKVPTTATTNSSSKKRYHQRTRQSLGSNSPTYAPENYPSLTETGLPIAYPAAQTSPKLASDRSKNAETRTTTQRTTSTSVHTSQTGELHNLVKFPTAAPQWVSVSSGSSEMPVNTATHTPNWSGSKAPTTTQRETLASKSPSYTPSNIPVMEEENTSEKGQYQLMNSKNHSWTSPEQNMTERSRTIKSPISTPVHTQFLFNNKQ